MPFMIVYGYTRIRGLSESLPGVPAIVRRQADESTTARSPRMLREQVRRVKRFSKNKSSVSRPLPRHGAQRETKIMSLNKVRSSDISGKTGRFATRRPACRSCTYRSRRTRPISIKRASDKNVLNGTELWLSGSSRSLATNISGRAGKCLSKADCARASGRATLRAADGPRSPLFAWSSSGVELAEVRPKKLGLKKPRPNSPIRRS